MAQKELQPTRGRKLDTSQMLHPAEQSAFLRWTDPKTAAIVRNTLVEVQDAGSMGLGLFALRDISRGTRIIEEEAMFVVPETLTIDDELNEFCSAFQQLTEAERSNFDQLHCCSDMIETKVITAVRRWRTQTSS
ncbi:hypothetical protein BM221_007782 [Beauveria bassiana]|uniref:SET domain-containing protein n=1 Tax=Beauveria bassiana TaxID=176275 RepID=A0A2N6NHU6_BEABA|nr:hypothetical protein BM221_007782 [Beauveria bassiana]